MKVRRRLLGLLAALSVLTYLDRVCISVAGPRMQQDLGLSPGQWGWVTGVFALAYGLFEIPNGILADRFGSRLMLARIVVWWSAFTALTGAVRSLPALLLTRFLFGAGEAGAYPIVSAVVSRWFPVSERGTVFGIVWMASQLGGALAPLLVVPVQLRFGWRASFYLFGAAGIVWVVAWWRWFRERPEQHGSVGAAELAEIRAGGGPPARSAVDWRALARSGSFRAVLLVAFCYCYAMYFFIAWAPTYLFRSRGFSEAGLALATAPFLLGALGNAVGGWAGDCFVKRMGLTRGRRISGVAGLLFAAACLAAAVGTHNRYAALAFLAACYAGICFQQPAVWAACVDIGGHSRSGSVSAAMNAAAQLGSFVLSVSYGRLVEATGDYDLALVPVIVALLCGALTWLRINPAEKLAG